MKGGGALFCGTLAAFEEDVVESARANATALPAALMHAPLAKARKSARSPARRREGDGEWSLSSCRIVAPLPSCTAVELLLLLGPSAMVCISSCCWPTRNRTRPCRANLLSRE